MIQLERIQNPDWRAIESHPDAMVCHSEAWFEFLRETQRVEPVILRLTNDNRQSLFLGGIVKKFGLRILGSPFPGWTTAFMGLIGDLPVVPGLLVVRDYAFQSLGVVQFECLQGGLRESELAGFSAHYRLFQDYVLDLSISADTLKAGFSVNARRNLNRAHQSGVRIVINPADSAFAEIFYQQLLDTFARQGLKPTYSPERVNALLRHLRDSQRVTTAWAEDGHGKILATNLTTGNHHRAYLWGGTMDREYRHLRPSELLQWEVIQHWQQRGTRFFDFGGAGDYKKKYGGELTFTPYLRFSRYPLLESLRSLAMALQRWRQRQGVAKPSHDEGEMAAE